MLAFARVGLGLAGLLCLAIAAIFDLEFVGRHLAADGAVTPGQAAALPAARLALAGLGLLVLAIAAFLERILAAPWLDRFLSSRRRVEWTIFLAPLVILIALAGYKLVRGPGDPFYLLAVREDSLVEWLTALAFFAGVVASCLLVKKMLLGTPSYLVGLLRAAGSVLSVRRVGGDQLRPEAARLRDAAAGGGAQRPERHDNSQHGRHAAPCSSSSAR